MTALDGCQSRGVTEPQRDGGSRKADGEGKTMDFLSLHLVVLISGLPCTKPSPVGEGGPLAVDEVSKIVVLPRNTSSASFLGTFSHWRRLFVPANRSFAHSRGGTFGSLREGSVSEAD